MTADDDQPPLYLWHEGVQPPPGMKVRQVYGYVFDSLGRVVLLRDCEHGRWNLPGGTPEPSDADQVATLEREVWEEVQVSLTEPVYLGYQEVRRPGRAPYAQVRMAALLVRVGEREPDPDHGGVHGRRRCSLPQAADLLAWGAPAQPQFKAAARVAQEWRLPVGAPAPLHDD